MALRTPEQYVESIQDDRHVYFRGQRVSVTEDPLLRLVVEKNKQAYAPLDAPGLRERLVVTLPDGEPARRWFSLPRTPAELEDYMSLIREEAPGSGIFEDVPAGLQALAIVTRRVDAQCGTGYSRRVKAYWDCL